MSLRVVHIIFITLAVLLCLAVGVWCFQVHSMNPNRFSLFLGIISIVSSIGLGIYGVNFLNKYKNLGSK